MLLLSTSLRANLSPNRSGTVQLRSESSGPDVRRSADILNLDDSLMPFQIHRGSTMSVFTDKIAVFPDRGFMKRSSCFFVPLMAER